MGRNEVNPAQNKTCLQRVHLHAGVLSLIDVVCGRAEVFSYLKQLVSDYNYIEQTING
jgi:hypothetical protein